MPGFSNSIYSKEFKSMHINYLSHIQLGNQQYLDYLVQSTRDEENVIKLQHFIDNTEHPFSRETKNGHITGSGFIVDLNLENTLLLHHRKLNAWLQPGGHCDGISDVRNTALRETIEETGLENIRLVDNTIFDIDIHLIPENPKESAHFHYDIRFLVIAEMEQIPKIEQRESLAYQWIALNKLDEITQMESVLVMRDKVLLNKPYLRSIL